MFAIISPVQEEYVAKAQKAQKDLSGHGALAPTAGAVRKLDGVQSYSKVLNFF